MSSTKVDELQFLGWTPTVLALLDTLLALRDRADPHCLNCKGRGYRMGPDKAVLACHCTKREQPENVSP